MDTASRRFSPASEESLIAEEKRYTIFFNLSIALASITFFELIMIVLPFPRYLLFTVLMLLSIAKFAGVVWYFMHLRWDRYFLALLFLCGLSLAVGTVAVLILLFPIPEELPDVETAQVVQHAFVTFMT